MSHILITNRLGKTTRLYLGRWQWSIIVLVFAALVGGTLHLGGKYATKEPSPDFMLTTLHQELNKYQDSIEKIRQHNNENMNALALRLGELKAHVIRLNALGERLTEKVSLDNGEFNFNDLPAQGGPELAGAEVGVTSAPDFMKDLDDMAMRLDHSALQLDVLESLLMNRDLRDEVSPKGRPIKSGWISSYFGYRNDPFSGRRTHHNGIDLAGKRGSDVIAVASGVVTWASKRYGYGDLVEINHGNGYVTRYGHNESIDVEVGSTVKKGQTIAKMGSSGRSTGPHVHFEVIRNGRAVDPMKYVKAS